MRNDLFTDSMLVGIHHELRERNKQLRRMNGELLWEDLSKEEKLSLSEEKEITKIIVLTIFFGSLGLVYVSLPIAIMMFFANMFLHLFGLVFAGVYGIFIVRTLTIIIGVFMVINYNKKIVRFRNKHGEKLRRMGWTK